MKAARPPSSVLRAARSSARRRWKYAATRVAASAATSIYSAVFCALSCPSARHDQQLGRRVAPIFDQPIQQILGYLQGDQDGLHFDDHLRRGLLAQRVSRPLHVRGGREADADTASHRNERGLDRHLTAGHRARHLAQPLRQRREIRVGVDTQFNGQFTLRVAHAKQAVGDAVAVGSLAGDAGAGPVEHVVDAGRRAAEGFERIDRKVDAQLQRRHHLLAKRFSPGLRLRNLSSAPAASISRSRILVNSTPSNWNCP